MSLADWIDIEHTERKDGDRTLHYVGAKLRVGTTVQVTDTVWKQPDRLGIERAEAQAKEMLYRIIYADILNPLRNIRSELIALVNGFDGDKQAILRDVDWLCHQIKEMMR